MRTAPRTKVDLSCLCVLTVSNEESWFSFWESEKEIGSTAGTRERQVKERVVK